MKSRKVYINNLVGLYITSDSDKNLYIVNDTNKDLTLLKHLKFETLREAYLAISMFAIYDVEENGIRTRAEYLNNFYIIFKETLDKLKNKKI